MSKENCPLCKGGYLLNECPQSCDGSHVDDLLWICGCIGPLKVTKPPAGWKRISSNDSSERV